MIQQKIDSFFCRWMEIRAEKPGIRLVFACADFMQIFVDFAGGYFHTFENNFSV